MALILTRRPGESVKIGDNVVMTVREVHPKKVYMEIQRFKGPLVERADHVWMRLLESTPENDYSDGHQCKLTIAAISGRQVRLHFEADNSVKIVRTELLK